MKKILLATTFLVATTGFAAAEISFAGTAKMGIARVGGTDAVAATEAGEPGTEAEIAAAETSLGAALHALIHAGNAYDAALDAYNAAPSEALWDAVVAAGIAADAANVAFEAAEVALASATDGAPAADAVDATPNGDFETYSSAELAVTFSGDTDNGLTFGADFSVSLGRSYTLGDADGFADEDGTFGMPTIWVDGAYGKLSISDDNFDFFDDAHGGGDVKYEGTFGAFSVGLITDVDKVFVIDGDVPHDDAETGVPHFAAKAAYTAGNLAASFNADTYGLWNVDASYTFNVITATVATNEAAESSVKIAYASGPITASVKYNTADESVDIAAGLVNNGMTLNAEYNTVSAAYEVTTSFDLGGGLALEAGANQTGDVMIGAAMEF